MQKAVAQWKWLGKNANRSRMHLDVKSGHGKVPVSITRVWSASVEEYRLIRPVRFSKQHTRKLSLFMESVNGSEHWIVKKI